MNVNSIAKAFPDWVAADSIVYSERGHRVRKPDFHRVFTLLFDSEQEADEAVKKLSDLPAVAYAERNMEATVGSDPRYLDGTQWHLKNDGRHGGVVGADIRAENAWDIFTGSPNITIAIFDDGVETNHVEFFGKASGDLPLSNSSTHGTEVAGVAAAWANNGQLGRGLDWNARIRSYRIFDNGEFIGDVAAAAKIVDAVNQGCQILNNSWAGTAIAGPRATLGQAFAYAYKMNRVSIAIMGNEGNIQATLYPGAFSNVIAVGSTTNRDVLSGFSTIGNHIDVVAPGGIGTDSTNPANIFTTTIGNSYTFVSGTSFAAPLVSGLASLLKGYNNNLSNDDIRQIISLSADKVPGMNGANFSNRYGFGRINAGRALALVRDNQLRHWTATGGTIVSSTGAHNVAFHSASGLMSGIYRVIRHEVRRTVTFPEQFQQTVGIWGRGVGSTGWSWISPNYGEGFTEVVSSTSSNVTLRTYVYEVWNLLGQSLGYYPTTPGNVTFAYTVLGNNCNINFTNQNVTTGTTVTSCGSLNVQNVNVQGGAGLILRGTQIQINGPFTVHPGATFEARTTP
jgi:thermitase